MLFSLKDLSPEWLGRVAEHYEEHGFFLLEGMDEASRCFRPVILSALGLDEAAFDRMLTSENPPFSFSTETRRKLAKATTTPAITSTLLNTLGPVLKKLIGPLTHISTTFHAQFKEQGATPVDHGGYPDGSTYKEVHGPYLLHQDFTGATIPTSPSALTVWVPLKASANWNLRVYPGSHREGLISSRWWSLEEPRLKFLNPPVDIAARRGTAIIFNALLLHGTSNPGPERRVSCDIRFFPLCGYLPSPVHFIGEDLAASLRQSVETGPVLQAPLLEDRMFLGETIRDLEAPPKSVLNWPNFIAAGLRNDKEAAARHLARFTNEEIGTDPASVYAAKFLGYPVHEPTLRTVHERLGLPYATTA